MYYLFVKARGYILIAIALILAITVMKYWDLLERKFSGNAQRSSNISQQAAPGIPAGGQPNSTAMMASPSSSSEVRVQLTQAQSLLEKASDNSTEALKHILTWQSEIESLNDVGIEENTFEGEGSDASRLFDRLAYVVRQERTSPEKVREAASQIKTLQTRIDHSLQQSNPTALSAVQMADVSRLHARCEEANKDWKRDVEQALAIKHLIDTQAERSTTPSSPSTVGSKLKEADGRAALDAVDKQMARQEIADEIEKQQEAEKAALLAKATSPKVKAILAPFLEPRDVQPRISGASIAFTRTIDKKPMSLRALYDIKALADSMDGLKRLAKLGGHRKLSEPRWSVHSQPNNWSDDDKAMLMEAQQMLRDYGSVLVEARLLSE